MNIFIRDEFTYKFGKDTESFEMIIINNELYDKYYWSYKRIEEGNIFAGHAIIQNIDIFENIMKDGFNNKSNISIKFNDIKEIITIEIDIIYIKDSIAIKMTKTEQEFGRIIKKTEEALKEKIKDMEKIIADLNEENIRQKIEFEEYIVGQPIMIIEQTYHNNGIRRQPHMYIFSNETKIRVYYYEGKYYSSKPEKMKNLSMYGDYIQYNEYLNFSVKKFKYLMGLESIVFDNCPFKNLNFIDPNYTKNLQTVTLINMTKLTTIEHLIKFENIKTIEISNSCNIKDLEKLMECKNLKLLVLPSGTNIDSLSNSTFEITLK